MLFIITYAADTVLYSLIKGYIEWQAVLCFISRK